MNRLSNNQYQTEPLSANHINDKPSTEITLHIDNVLSMGYIALLVKECLMDKLAVDPQASVPPYMFYLRAAVHVE